ncbi:MAG: tRNA-dihydrouridine synthase, partial [Pseudomonadota bacterium]
RVQAAGASGVTVHARKAWLQGLSPKENRDIPPLDYPLVHAMKAEFPDLPLSINGGIMDLDSVEKELEHMDGVMVGRAAYHNPAGILSAADARIFGGAPGPSREQAVARMEPYIANHLAQGGTLHQVTRHMLGLYTGLPGARGWRRALSEGATQPGAGLEVLRAAQAHVRRQPPQAAE